MWMKWLKVVARNTECMPESVMTHLITKLLDERLKITIMFACNVPVYRFRRQGKWCFIAISQVNLHSYWKTRKVLLTFVWEYPLNDPILLSFPNMIIWNADSLRHHYMPLWTASKSHLSEISSYSALLGSVLFVGQLHIRLGTMSRLPDGCGKRVINLPTVLDGLPFTTNAVRGVYTVR